ncbi:MAG TPA: hypothetical protein PKD55_13640 [Bellilinea sp.]|nr:hypothetical protein [Bellilinea sp.]
MKFRKFALIFIGILIVFGLMLLILTQVPSVRSLLDDKLYDNYDPRLPCDQWPTSSELDTVRAEHSVELQRIAELSPNILIDHVDMECAGVERSIWRVNYASHEERLMLEEALGGKEVFGQPAIWRNW